MAVRILIAKIGTPKRVPFPGKIPNVVAMTVGYPSATFCLIGRRAFPLRIGFPTLTGLTGSRGNDTSSAWDNWCS